VNKSKSPNHITLHEPVKTIGLSLWQSSNHITSQEWAETIK